MNAILDKIINKSLSREPLSFNECKTLLSFDENSYESGLIRNAANFLIRDRSDNSAIIIGQVGVDIHPCNAGCSFCSFGEGHTVMPKIRPSKDEINKKIQEFCKEGDLFGLYLMTMADVDKEYLLDLVEYARKVTPSETQIWVNTGDCDRVYYEELKSAGAVGAYHVCRIREGIDTKPDPKVRINSLNAIKEAGLQLFSCCEPIGPEHTIDEIAENILLCRDLNVTQFGAMKRVAVPGSCLYNNGEISNLKMAHIMGCVGLVYASVNSAEFFGVHEPCEVGYMSGANFATAETGANPRDVAIDTSKGRGWDMNRCRKLLFECGFKHLLKGDMSKINLDFEYLKKTDSLF